MFRDNNIIEIDKPCISEQEFIEFMLERDYNENMFNKDGTLNKNYSSSKVTGLISTILEDYSDEFFNKYGDQINKYRPNAYIEIKKVIDCHNKNLGCSLYQCPNCSDIVFIGHTCKSRLCTSCGYKYKNERVENILETAYSCNHRQIVFTIPKELRNIFYYPYEERIDILFEAPIEAVLEFEQEDEWNGLPISTPPYIICSKCNFDKCVPIDYQSSRGYHHIYKDN